MSMTIDELLTYAGNRNGYVGVDLRFDKNTNTPRVVEIHFFRGSWSVDLRYLTYDLENNLDDSQYTQARITGGYNTLQELVTSLEEYIGKSINEWVNYSRSGYEIILSPEEISKYQAIDWANWLPEEVEVPDGTEFTIIRPLEWVGVTHLIRRS